MSIPLEYKYSINSANEIKFNKALPLDDSSSAKGSRPLANAPSYIHILNQTPKHSKFVAVLLKFAVEYVVFAAQSVFYAVKDIFFKNRSSLFTFERLKTSHLNIYFKKFNQEDNGAIFTNPFWGILDGFDADWSAGNTCHFDFIIEKMIEDNFPEVDKKEFFDLSSELLKRNKSILAIPIYIRNTHHWTVLHINFKTETVSFADSKGEASWNKKTHQKINERIDQAVTWLRNKDTHSNAYSNLKKAPICTSQIYERIQYDTWNSFYHIIQMTYLVAKENKGYQEIESLPFAEIERQITARRNDVLTTVNEELTRFNF
jgi:hypothetical protein